MRTCVKAQLKAKGFTKEPYDLEGTMGGAYGYSPPLMISFHRDVQTCLAKPPHFKYQYDKTDDDYIAKTLAMKLREIYVEIEFRTSGPGVQVIAASDDAELAATVSVAGPGTQEPAKKPANKAAKPAAKTPATKPARKKTKRTIATAKKAKGKPKKQSNKR